MIQDQNGGKICEILRIINRLEGDKRGTSPILELGHFADLACLVPIR